MAEGKIYIPKEVPRWMYEAFRQLSRSANVAGEQLAAVGRGEAPDGSGTTLIDTSRFFYLPGRVSGQIGYGGISGNDDLTLSSTSASDKGFIYLGEPTVGAALDEDQGFLGIGTSTPAARVHVKTTALGTAVIGALGTPHARFTYASTNLLDIVPLLNTGAGVDIALSVTSGSVQFLDTSLGAVGLRIAFSSTVSFVQAGRIDSGSVVNNRNLQFGGMNATVGASLLSNFRGVTFTSTTEGAGGGGAAVGTADTIVAINLAATDYLTSLPASDVSLLVGPRPSATCAPIVAEQSSTTVNGLEYRHSTTGTGTAKVLGYRKLALGPGLGSLTNEGSFIGYIGNVEVMRLSPSTAAALQWGFQSPAGLNQIGHTNTAGWADSVANSTRIDIGDLHASTHRAVCLLSAGGNRFTRFGIGVIDGMTIENAFLGGGATAMSVPAALLYIVNNATDGADAKILLALNSKRAAQSGDMFRCTSQAGTLLFQVLSNGTLQSKHASGDQIVRFQPFSNTFTTKLFISSSSSGDGGLYYDSNANRSNIFSYGDLRFNVGSVNISNVIGDQQMVILGGTGANKGDTGIGIAAPTAKLHLVNTVTDATVVMKIETTLATKTGDLLQLISAVASTVNTTWNARNVMATGRIKEAVLFTDDNATIASAKLLAHDVSTFITAGQTRTLQATDQSGIIVTDVNVLTDEDGDLITMDGELLLHTGGA
jgi:hypothetical protein